MTPDEFFEGRDASRKNYEAVKAAIEAIGPAEIRISRSQIAFRRKRGFAWAWIPGKYLHGKTAPLVLSIGLRRRDNSSRWKQIAEPYPRRFIHHLELYETTQIDDEVRSLLAEAWDLAR